MKTQVSIIIPVIRPEKAQRCQQAILDHCDQIDYETVVLIDKERIGAPKMVKKLVEMSTCQKVMFLGDDTIPQQGFLKEALEAEKHLPGGWGLVALNDGRNLPKEAAHWMCDKRLLPLIGGEFFHTGYWHCYCDSELSLRTQLLGKYVFAEKSRIIHEHPIFEGVPTDKDYKRVYSPKFLEHDRMLFYKRREAIIKENETNQPKD